MGRRYDFVAIGGGSAGYNAARVAASLGKRVAVVDGARKLGGLCILRGCMPSKTLIYAAEVLHMANKAGTFGLRVSGASADMAAVQERKKRIIAAFAHDRVKGLTSGKFDLIRSFARFVDPHTIEVEGGKRITSTHFLIGTGSKVSVPPVPGLAESKFWTSDDVLELDFKPKSVIVLGGGIVACELAQFLRRIGTRVCLIQRGEQVLKEHSKEAAEVVLKAFRDDGIEAHTGTKVTAVHSGSSAVTVTFKRGHRTFRRRADHLFNALGREPDTRHLCLEKAGVKTLASGRIATNRWQQTSAKHIYAAGDCCGPHEIVHIAIQQGELAARHAAHLKHLRPVDERLLLGVVFTDPQLATIGFGEKDLLGKGIPYLKASYPFDDHGKSMLMNATYGFVRVLAGKRDGRLLGAEIVGKDAGELIHCFSTPLQMKATVFDMLAAPWYHPTLSEIVTYPLEEIAEKVLRTHRQVR